MKEFSTRHETPNLSFVGAISITAARPNPGLVLLLTIMYWPTLPFGIYYCVTPDHYTPYFTLLFNTSKEEIVMGEMKSVKMGESKTATMSHMYYTFMQYHTKRGKN